MGWNDRLIEDPYWPEQNEDRESYENWLAYIENQLDEAEKNNNGLSSRTLTPADLQAEVAAIDQLREVINKTAQRKTDCGAPMPQCHEDHEDSRQSTYHQTEQGDRRTDASADR